MREIINNTTEKTDPDLESQVKRAVENYLKKSENAEPFDLYQFILSEVEPQQQPTKSYILLSCSNHNPVFFKQPAKKLENFNIFQEKPSF